MSGGLARWRVRVGYPAAIIYFWLAHPLTVWLIAGVVIGLAGLAVRALAAGYLHKQKGLAKAGPYACTRNPLYFGSALMALGFAVAARSLPAAAVVAAYFLIFYPATMRQEEAEMAFHFGAEFREYAARVPLFWPRLRRNAPGSAAASERFSWAQYRRNREFKAAAGMAVAVLLLVLKCAWMR
jgi:protein-S-isoprenylcysteine O-methyltransferase Ste14